MFRSLKPEEFQQDFDLNVMGAVRLLQKLQLGLKAVPGSSVVLFSTVAVQQGMAFHSSIAAAKGAIEGLTRSLAAEWAPSIRVNAIAPSLVETPLSAKLLSSPEKVEASAKRHPLARVGRPEDIASLAVFLLSDKSGWITGQVMGVDGGMSVVR
jgi:NAD(P)-dependent dehydrogenase (short-subunit alcohol dehydrogenase family)